MKFYDSAHVKQIIEFIKTEKNFIDSKIKQREDDIKLLQDEIKDKSKISAFKYEDNNFLIYVYKADIEKFKIEWECLDNFRDEIMEIEYEEDK